VKCFFIKKEEPMKFQSLYALCLLTFFVVGKASAQDTLSTGITCCADILDDWKDQDNVAAKGYRAVIASIIAALPSADKTLLQPRLDNLANQPDDAAHMEGLYARACSARRAQLMAHYVGKFSKVLFSEHPRRGGAYFWDNYWAAGGVSGKGLGMLAMNGYYGSVSQLLSSGEARCPDVSFDGTRAVFAWRGGSSGSSVYHLYEIDLGSHTTRQLTSGNNGEFTIDLDPCYLPNGNIVFVSTRYAQEIDCIAGHVTNLFLCDKNGKYMRQIGFDQAPICYPGVLPSGQVMYARWDYNDKAHSYAHAIFTMNPDGTVQRELCNNNSWWPTDILQARSIPGTTKLMAMIGGYHTPQWGKIGIIDVNVGMENGQGVTLVAPVRLPQNDNLDSWGSASGGPYAWRQVDAAVYPRSGAAALDQWGQNPPMFAYPYPFDETAFLVSFRPASKNAAWGDRMALYFMTVDGKRELLYADASSADCSIMSAIPGVARFVPPILSSTIDYRDSTGIFQIMNMYQGQSLPGIAAGAIKRLRVAELYFRPGPVVDGGASYSHCGPGDINYGGASYHTAIATPNASWDAKWIVGETPVLSDGSANFIVPARTPLFFQALNDKGQVVQTMRSWTTLQPGETFSCAGCHESRLNPPAPLTYIPLAIKQGAVPLEPFYGPRRGFNFNTEVQPILNAKCVSCHNATTPNGINLSGTMAAQSVGNPINQSYLNLVSHGSCDNFSKYVSWFTAEDSPVLQPPYRAGSFKSHLDSLLTNGHHNVQMTDQEMRTIRCWIDLGVPMWGTYQEGHPGSEAQLTQRNVWLAQERSNIAALINDFPLGTNPGAHGHEIQGGYCSAPAGSWACGVSYGRTPQVWFSVPAGADMQSVRIRLYNMRGALLSEVLDKAVKAGFHTQMFTGTFLAAGQCFVKIQTRGFEKSLPVLMVR
jgi:hypothetical protein